jgi:hypothetical protein
MNEDQHCPCSGFTGAMTDQTGDVYFNTTREFDQEGLDAKDRVTK